MMTWRTFWMIVTAILLAFFLLFAGCMVCTASMIAVGQANQTTR